MIKLRRGKIVNYRRRSSSLINISSDISHVAEEVKKRNEGERYYIVVESQNRNKISRGETTELSARVFVKGLGLDITNELKKSNIIVKWSRTTTDGRDRSGITDSLWSENKTGFTCPIRYEETSEKNLFTVEIAEKSITDALLPQSPIPGSVVMHSPHLFTLDFIERVKGTFEIIDDTTNQLKTETRQNKKEVLLSQIELEVVEISGSRFFRNNRGSVTLEARVKFGEQDITEEMRLAGITFEWLRKNPSGIDENGLPDSAWMEAHRGRYQVTFTGADNVGNAQIGCKILNTELIERWVDQNHLNNN